MRRLSALVVGPLCLTLQVCLGQTGFGGLGGFGAGIGSGLGTGTTNPTNTHTTIAPYAAVQSYYSRVLGPLGLGFQNRRDSIGYSGMAGISGGRSWERTSLGFSYTAGIMRNPYLYTEKNWTQTHAGALTLNHAFTSRLTVTVSEMAGTSIGGSNGFGLGGVMGSMFGLGSLSNFDYGGNASFVSAGNYLQNGLVDGELFNRRVNFSATTGGLSYRLTERWFVTATGTGAFVRRDGSLFGNDSQSVSGQLGYIIDSRSEAGVAYTQFWNQTTNLFGGVRARAANLFYTRRLPRRSSLSVMGGGVEIRSNFVGTVPVPAEIAELTGQAASFEVRKVQYFSAGFGGAFSQRYQTSSLNVAVNRGFSPGNGVLLAGVRDMAFLSYSMFENHRVGLQALGTAARTSSSLTSIRRSSYYSAGLGTSFRIYRQLLTSISAGYREARISGAREGRSVYLSVGLIWSPREFAFPF